MAEPLSDAALDQIFRKARTYSHWLDQPVTDETLHQLYELMKWGPTSMNTCPARIVFVRSPQAKQRLLPALLPGNVEKTMTAPVTAIVGYDVKFYEKLTKLWPPNPKAGEMFASNPELVETTARRNGSLQGAYLIVAARSLGLDCGPMSGFDNAKVDQEFFSSPGTADGGGQEWLPESHIKSNFLCNLGYGDPAKLYPRGPRLDFHEACAIV